MIFRSFAVSIGILAGAGTTMVMLGGVAHAQDTPAASNEAQQQFQQAVTRIGVLQRITFDPKLADELELAPDQKKKILVALQKHQDKMRNMVRLKPGETIDQNLFQKTILDLLKEVDSLLTEKQATKLTELAKNRPALSPATVFSAEKAQEMQKLNLIMQELMRINYDPKLAEELNVTAEQRVDIQEAQASFQLAMQERSKAGPGQAFDMESFNKMISDLMLSAQEILTPEQSEKLSRIVKLKGLKQKFGDDFAMINGLAEDFNLDEKNQQQLSEKIASVREDYYDQWLDLKKESMQKIIRVLPEKHRKEAEDAVKGFLEEDPRNATSPFQIGR